MAGLSFDVTAKFEQLEKLKREFSELKVKVEEFYRAGNNADASKMETSMRKQKKEIEGLEKTLAPCIYQYQKLSEQSKKTFEELSKATALQSITEQIEIQKRVIADLERQYESYKNTVQNTVRLNPTAGQENEMRIANQLARQAKSELEAEKKALAELEKQYKSAVAETGRLNSAKATYMTQIRQTKQAMMELSAQNKQGTAEYEALQAKLKELGIAMRMVNKEMKSLTTSGTQLQGFLSGIRGVAGAFTATQGAMSMFVKDNEKLAAVQTKLQAAMSITIGLQATSEMLHKTSAFRMTTVAKATQLWNSAVKALNVQLGISVALSKALVAGGIGLIIAAVAGLIVAFKNWNREQNELNKAQSEAQKSIQSEITNLRTYESILRNANNTNDIRLEALKKLKESMPQYNAMLDKEGKLIEDNTNSLTIYIKKIKTAAEAKIAADRLVEAENKFSDWVAGLSKSDREILISGQMGMLKSENTFAYNVLSEQREKMLEDIDKWNKRLEKSQAESFASSAAKEGSKEYWENQQQNAKKFLESMKDTEKGSEKWLEQLSKYNEATKKLEAWSLTPEKPEKPKYDDTDERIAAINEMQKRMEQQQTDGLLELRQIEIDLMADSSEKVLAQIELDYDKRMNAIAKRGDEMIKQQDDLQRKMWEAENPNWKEKGLTPPAGATTREKLPKEQREYLDDAEAKAEEVRTKAEAGIIKDLLEKYQDYADKRLAIEERFNRDIAVLQMQRADAIEKGDTKLVGKLDSAINQATKNKGKELATFDFGLLKESPEYVKAFEDLRKTSTETLTYLLQQLEAMKYEVAETLDPKDIKEYTSVIEQIFNELNMRDPFKTLTDSQNRLTQATKKAAVAQKELAMARLSKDTERQALAEVELRNALDDVQRASIEVVDAQKKVNEVYSKLFETISQLGDVIGGQAGEIINLISDIGGFVLKSIDGVKAAAAAGATALATLEKASAILAIIQIVIQLMSKISELIKDANQQYQAFAEKQAIINNLAQSVRDYEIAVERARDAEESWFGRDSIRSLKQAYDERNRIMDAYQAKLHEQQATYQNETGEGWLTPWLDKGGLAVTAFLSGDILTGTGALAAGLKNAQKYIEGTTEAIANLRIETRKAKKGFLGSGIGRQSQITEDLIEWVRREYGADLFDENGWLNRDLYKQLLQDHEDKLVGETRATLDALDKYAEEYEKYQEMLREYVSSLYEPLVDNFVDSIWDWFDNGKDALDSFKEYASNTFRAIVSDMIRTIILEKIVGTFADDIAKLYEDYSAGALSEEELIGRVADMTNDIISKYQDSIPALQGIMTTMTDAFKLIGIDLQKATDASENTLRGAFAKASQESIDLLAGQFGRIRVILEEMLRMQVAQLEMKNESFYAGFINGLEAIKSNQAYIREDVSVIKELCRQVTGNSEEIRLLTIEVVDGNKKIVTNTGNAVSELNIINTQGVKPKGLGLGL